VRLITDFGGGSSYDLIAKKGYLGELELPITCDDVTKLILKNLKNEEN